MNYPSPNDADFAEIQSLNAAFLNLLSADSVTIRQASGLPPEMCRKISELPEERSRRLAEARFFLFSIRESDSDYWEGLHRGGNTRSLFEGGASCAPDWARFMSAALGFIWQMARQNPYFLRLTCCASLHWAERIAEQPLVALIGRAANQQDLLRLRAGDDPCLWRRLLAASAEPDQTVRVALLNSVLQTLLVAPATPNTVNLRSAACRVDVPAASLSAED